MLENLQGSIERIKIGNYSKADIQLIVCALRAGRLTEGSVPQGIVVDGRGVIIKGDAIGTIIVTGDNNVINLPSFISTIVDETYPSCPFWQERLEKSLILDCLNNNYNQLIGIWGVVGCGKSVLAAQIAQNAQNFQETFWINFQKPYPFEQFSHWLLERKLKPQLDKNTIFTDEELTTQMLNCFVSNRWLLVLDNVETLLTMEDLWKVYQNFLTHWSRTGSGSSILLTSRKRIEIESCRWFPLAMLNHQQSITVLKKISINRSEDDLKKLTDLTLGNPLLLKFVAKRENLEKIDCFKSKHELLDQLTGFHRNNDEFSIGQVLKEDYECLRSPLKKLLQSVSIYRTAFNLKAIHKVTLDEQISKRELNELVEQSFLLEVQQEQLWESHPLIKPYVQDLLLEDDRKRLHSQAISYYDAVKRSTWRDLKDTTEYQELFYHLCELQQYLEALNLLWQSGENSSLDVFLDRRGYNSIRADLYESLRQRWQPADGKEWQNFRKMLNCLGNAYHALGENRLAQEAYEQALQILQI